MKLLEALPEADRLRARRFWGICVFAAMSVGLIMLAAMQSHAITPGWALAGIIVIIGLEIAPVVWVLEYVTRRELHARRQARAQAEQDEGSSHTSTPSAPV